MPYNNRTEARNAILGLVKDQADVLVTGGSLNKVLWDGKSGERPTDPAHSWARVTLSHTGGEVAALNGCPPGNVRRYNRSALLTIQIFEPSGTGRTVGDVVAQGFEGALQGSIDAEGLVVRSVYSIEAGTDGPWDITNTIATIEYDVFG